MNQDLTLVATHIGVPPSPSSAVLDRAREAAGLPVPQEVFYEPLALQARRRPRRKLVSLTVTLAACFAAGAVGIVVAVHPGTRATDSLGFATDAQLASATSFHMAFHEANPACPQSMDTYLLRRPGTAKPVGLGLTDCGHVFSINGSTAGEPGFSVGGRSFSWGRLPSAPTDPATITHLIQAYFTKNPPGFSSGDPVADFAGVELIAPLPRAVRRGLVEAIAARPSVSSSDGHDALGRPVRWLHDRNGNHWLGVDPSSDWVIAYGSGPAAAGGGPSTPGNVVTAIDTQQPPARAYPTGHVVGTVAGATDAGFTFTGPDGQAGVSATGGRFNLDLPPGTYTVTGSVDGSGKKFPPASVTVPAHGTVTLTETLIP